MRHIAVLEGGGLSVAVDGDGRIAAVGTDSEVQAQLGEGIRFEREIDAKGMCILPGLVDAHTHPVWVGDRVHEFAMKVFFWFSNVLLLCNCTYIFSSYNI